LDAVKLVHPGLILLDIRLPDIDGVEVCRRLKADLETAGIRVIFVTSLSETSIGLEGFEAGAVDFITKPIMPELVIARVKSHLSLVQVDRLKSAYNDAISMLAIAGDYNDSETGIHIRRMAAVSACVARHAGWSADRVEHMELAAACVIFAKWVCPVRFCRSQGRSMQTSGR
jgi:putative two-component system response regulator